VVSGSHISINLEERLYSLTSPLPKIFREFQADFIQEAFKTAIHIHPIESKTTNY